MPKSSVFLGILLFLLFISSFLVFIRFSIFDNNLKKTWEYQQKNIQKALFKDKVEGEKTVFSLPVQYVGELDIDLVGENVQIYQDPEVETIEVEIYYPKVEEGTNYTKISYQLINQGDVAFFKTDKNLWKKWKSQSPNHKLLVGFIFIRVPKDFATLKITSISGDSQIIGSFKEVRFSSLSGDLSLKGNVYKSWLNTWEGNFYLEGSKDSTQTSFFYINFNSFFGKLSGKGNFENMVFNSLSAILDWQGSGKILKARSFFLQIKASFPKILKADWNIITISSVLYLNLPRNAKSHSQYRLGRRYEILDEIFHISLHSFSSSFDRSYVY